MEEKIRNWKYPKKLGNEELENIIRLSELVREFDEYSSSDHCRAFLDDPMNLWRYMIRQWEESNGVERAAGVLQKVVKWRNEYKPHEIHKNQRFLGYIKEKELENLSFAFFSGEDGKGHPIAYLFAEEEKNIEPRDDRRMNFFVDLVCFMLECSKKKFRREKGPEGFMQIILVVDVSNIGISHITLVHPLIKTLLVPLADRYYEYIFKAYVVNASMMIRTLWRIITPFLYETTVKKYNFCKDATILNSFLDESQIPERLGGKKKIEYSLIKHIEDIVRIEEMEAEEKKKKDGSVKEEEEETEGEK